MRHLPNVKLVHFNALKADLGGQIRQIAAFLDIAIDEAKFPKIVEHCTFDYMKAHAEAVTPLGGALWEGGGGAFLHKGVNGRWRGTLTAEEIAAYEARAIQELGIDCASWLSGDALGAAAG